MFNPYIAEKSNEMSSGFWIMSFPDDIIQTNQ